MSKDTHAKEFYEKGERAQGLTSQSKGTVVSKEKRAPYRPEYLKMSKANFIEAERKRKENDLKIEEYRKRLEAGDSLVVEQEVQKIVEPVESKVVEKAKIKK